MTVRIETINHDKDQFWAIFLLNLEITEEDLQRVTKIMSLSFMKRILMCEDTHVHWYNNYYNFIIMSVHKCILAHQETSRFLDVWGYTCAMTIINVFDVQWYTCAVTIINVSWCVRIYMCTDNYKRFLMCDDTQVDWQL